MQVYDFDFLFLMMSLALKLIQHVWHVIVSLSNLSSPYPPFFRPDTSICVLFSRLLHIVASRGRKFFFLKYHSFIFFFLTAENYIVLFEKAISKNQVEFTCNKFTNEISLPWAIMIKEHNTRIRLVPHTHTILSISVIVRFTDTPGDICYLKTILHKNYLCVSHSKKLKFKKKKKKKRFSRGIKLKCKKITGQ